MKEILWMKKIRNIFIIFLFLFEFSVFSVPGINSTAICRAIFNRVGMSCNQISYTFDPHLKCLCDGNEVNNNPTSSCPSGSTYVKRPIPITSSYSISCDFKSYHRGKDTHESAYPSSTDRSEPLRSCKANLNVEKSLLSNSIYCGQHTGTNVPLTLQTVCPYNDLQQCKDELINMIEGRVTFKPGEVVSRNSSCCKKQWNHCTFATNYYRNNGSLVDNICTKKLYDRTTNLPVHDLFIPNNKLDRIVLASENGPFADMQCISDNIKYEDMCVCNNGNYEFELGQDFTCECCGGVDRDPNTGNCLPPPPGSPCCNIPVGTSNFIGTEINPPITAPGSCRCKCPNAGMEQTSFLVSNTATACPTTPPAECIINDKCPDEPNWNTSDPTNSPIHPFVTSKPGQINNADRCKNIGGLFVNTGVGFCEMDAICEPDVDDIACSSGTEETIHGKCQEVGVMQKVCLYGSHITPGDGNSNDDCPDGWIEEKVYGQHTVCMSIESAIIRGTIAMVITPPASSEITAPPCQGRLIRFPYVKLDTANPYPPCSPGKEKITLDPLYSSLVVASREVCSDPISSNGIPNIIPGSYICNIGAPSSLNDSCECKTSKPGQVCPATHDRTSDSMGLGSCDCLDSTWTNNSGTCSKTPSGSAGLTLYTNYWQSTGSKITPASLNPIYAHMPEPPGPATYAEAIADNWGCFSVPPSDVMGLPGLPWIGNPQPAYTCWKDTKSCPDGGTYNVGPPEVCEMPCTQQNDPINCRCVKDITSCECDTGGGWFAHGSKCRKQANNPSPRLCTCECYSPSQDLNMNFSPGDLLTKRMYEAISNDILANPTNPTICTEDTSGGDCDPVDSCCHQGVCHASCPVITPDNVCCKNCLDGSPIPAPPGGCCPNGTAIADLKNCSSGVHIGGNPMGIDIAFGSNNSASIYSVYSTGSMDRPDYICWMNDPNGSSTRVQKRDLLCPPQEDCGGGARDVSTQQWCQCQGLNASDELFNVDNTYCEYAARDPMRFEDGIIKGDLPSSRQNDKYETDIRIFKQTPIITP